ncbi:NUDIX hydrolase domain-like protein [Gilbertella persicaria]|uniref:NUDIX hydrolase domain-like protein n=1 Tax=Gilbertella persicaria TaxID=101096 RepID=UPI00221F534D|nr:NUDIX hydrolase domain-like protein [Gilbertella persicaria]KAI8048055.1 NUDIX hydrolase domain-like protein [Gilbertella persicaria]
MSVFTSKKILTLVLTLNEKEKKILLGMKKRGFGAGKFNGFGGKVEKGETIEQGAKRELMEECEIEAIDLEQKGLLAFTFENDPVALETHIFITRSFLGEPKETEEMKPQWFSFQDIPFDQMWTDDRYWFPFLLDNKTFAGHFHFAEDQKSVLKQDLHELEKLPAGFDLDHACLL